MFADETAYPPVDFLAIGHMCHDLVEGGRVAGGAATYGASTAQALGCRAGVVTSAAPADNWGAAFPDLLIHQIDAPATTVFENVYTPAGRVQTIHSVAGPLTAVDVPPPWTRAPIVQIGPIANEVDPALIHLFSASVVGVCPQGWMRRWDDAGRVRQVAWEGAAEVLPLAAATFVSQEDLPDAATLAHFRRLAPLLIVTAGPAGCTVYCRDEERSFPAPPVAQLDATGAGDVFAAAYLLRLFQTDGNIWEAAEFANRIAAASVTRCGLPAKAAIIRRLIDGMTHK